MNLKAKVNLNELKKISDEKYGFDSYFDMKTGLYFRTEAEDGKDAFKASFPQLLDIGIKGNCNHGLSGSCAENGIKCYQSGSSKIQPDMELGDFVSLMRQCEGKVFQVALGGRGDPETHRDFEAVLDAARSRGIVPNLTTSGYDLNSEKADIIAKYCGAAAVSWQGTFTTKKAIDLLMNAGAITNIHFVIGKKTIDKAIELMENPELIPKGVCSVIFLLLKPIGEGNEEDILQVPSGNARRFFRLADSAAINGSFPWNVGFDSCCVPALVENTKEIDAACYDACEGARFSAYVTPDMMMTPCSFDQGLNWGEDLRNKTISEIWDGSKFEDFRKQLINNCNGCADRERCFGGCPVIPKNTPCTRKNMYIDYEK